ncbi:MAG TPA: TIGR03619 family F420-dependent LLM class oxidoreductase [Terriglobales bacterium]|nr:TIGR03619 family F420-dependent LLM class oxidoreductase [Terriglobales bacterium]
MQIGVHLPTTQPGGVTKEALVGFALEAERREFASLWVSDHVVIPGQTDGYPMGGRFPIPPDRPYLEPIVALAAAAAVTTKPRLGCSVFILGHRHPVVMAKMLSSLDALSNGRLIVGVGVGWWKDELDILGAPFERRGRHADEALRVFKTLWTRDMPSFDGEFVRFPQVGFAPKPLQRPHPPIWVGGGSAGAYRRVVEHGDGWHAMTRTPEHFKEELAKVRAAADAAKRDMTTIELSLRFSLTEDLLAKGPQAAIDTLAQLKHLGLQHVLLEFRRAEHGRMFEILDLVSTTIRPAVNAA